MKTPHFLQSLLARARWMASDERGAITADLPHIPYYEQAAANRVRIQWSRRLFHMSSAIYPLLFYFSGMSVETGLKVFLLPVLIVVGTDIYRLLDHRFNAFYIQTVGKMLRPHEAHSLTTGTYFALICYFGLYFFGGNIMVLSVLLLAIGDPVAAIVGLKFGTIKIFGKSLEGTVACFQVCFLISLAFYPARPLVALGAALAASLAELLPLPINDNVRIPLFTAMTVWFLA